MYPPAWLENILQQQPLFMAGQPIPPPPLTYPPEIRPY